MAKTKGASLTLLRILSFAHGSLNGESLRSTIFTSVFLGITFQNSGTREVVLMLGTMLIAGSESSCRSFQEECRNDSRINVRSCFWSMTSFDVNKYVSNLSFYLGPKYLWGKNPLGSNDHRPAPPPKCLNPGGTAQ